MDHALSSSGADRLPDGVVRMRAPTVAIGSHHYIALSLLNRWIEENAVPSARGALLDYGCGGMPYRSLFQAVVDRYVGADVSSARGTSPDVLFEPGRPLPLDAGSFDTVLSTQVLEHVADPRAYLAECARVLRAGGVLLLSVPMQWRHHEAPFDFWRFTRYGIEHLLQSAGFVVDRIDARGGAFAVAGQILASHLDESRSRHRWMLPHLNRIALALDRRRPDPEDALLWTVVARKP